MARAKIAPEVLAHLEWLGFVQPTGLVVSAPALVRAGAVLDRRDVEGQLLLAGCIAERTVGPDSDLQPYAPDFEAFARSVLGWSFTSKFYAGTDDSPMPAELEVALPEFEDTLRPDYAVREPDPNDDGSPWQLLVQVLDIGADFDVAHRTGGLEASAHGRMERLLRQTGVLAGVLFNGISLRLISAPRGESSGWFDVHVADMLTTAGRPICTALRLLLSENRLLSLPRGERLTALLDDSRRYQNEVSERLAEQVLHALYELLRGFQAANDASDGGLLRTQLSEHSDGVYHALLTVLLRLVFLLYAEERGMLPDDEAFVRFYSVAGLHERLREDTALYPDTMDQRFGAWAQLLTLFRIVHDGATAGSLHLPERHGVLFDPDRFPFLEGRPSAGSRQIHERIEPPLVPDGTVFRALEKLLVLDGERISYRALDVEQIGSVYETMMGFRLETAQGRSLAIKPAKRLGAPVTVNLEELLGTPSDSREKWIVEQTDRKLPEGIKKAVKPASSLDELHAALEAVIDRDATPDIVAKGSMILQPSQERRRSGSHYTPRSLTQPIVRTALAPILERLSGGDGVPPTPSAILDLKVCDPAMGSGAFLVETCRQLADVLLDAWEVHGGRPDMPIDEDEVVFARRLVAHRCLYGVDRNPVAVDLAKMSLWLVTLAREHPLTFVDHALKHGDSLVGLTIEQIEAFHWRGEQARGSRKFVSLRPYEHIERATQLRDKIRNAGDDTPEHQLKAWLRDAADEMDRVRLVGDLVVAAFFTGSKRKERDTKLATFADAVERGEADKYRSWLEEWRHAERPLVPFHWWLEVPEVFDREPSGFDAFVGNPPFQWGNRISVFLGPDYRDWLLTTNEDAIGTADLVVYFFRRAFAMLRHRGVLGLLATNSIAEGDTRAGGLDYLLKQSGVIVSAQPDFEWPGDAVVRVSAVHVYKGEWSSMVWLNRDGIERIGSDLRPYTNQPVRLRANGNCAFKGVDFGGEGFLLSLEEYETIRLRHPGELQYVWPTLNAEDFLRVPPGGATRFIINFGKTSLETAEQAQYCLEIVKQRVKPMREAKKGAERDKWWRFRRSGEEYQQATSHLLRVLINPVVAKHLVFAFADPHTVFTNALNVFAFENSGTFALLQSRVHEVWALRYRTTLESRTRYNVSDCFETFPFYDGQVSQAVDAAGASYYDFRAALMAKKNEGFTKTYNRFHDPEERDPEIVRLRELHAAMDRAVLNAYGWSDLATTCEFLLDFEIDEDEWGRKRKPYRYRWPDDVQAVVLMRLLELNAERAAKESQAGGGGQPGRKLKRRSVPGPEPEKLDLDIDA